MDNDPVTITLVIDVPSAVSLLAAVRSAVRLTDQRHVARSRLGVIEEELSTAIEEALKEEAVASGKTAVYGETGKGL